MTNFFVNKALNFRFIAIHYTSFLTCCQAEMGVCIKRILYFFIKDPNIAFITIIVSRKI